jgi:hypothetical protein
MAGETPAPLILAHEKTRRCSESSGGLVLAPFRLA